MKSISSRIGILVCIMTITALLTIAVNTGCKKQAEFSFSEKNGNVTIERYNGKGGDVVIPAEIGSRPVTAIGEKAFAHCSTLTSVAIPDSVITIDERAFLYCTSMTDIIIPDSVTNIGDEAFAYSGRLGRVIIPESVEKIGNSAFMRSSDLVICGVSGSTAEEFAKENNIPFEIKK